MIPLTYMQLLRGSRSFRRLWVGQIVSELGNWFSFIAALGLVRAVSDKSPEAAAIMFVAQSGTFSVVALAAGAYADRWSRRTLMIASDLLRAVVALGFLFVRRPEDLWIAYTCVALSAGLSAFFEAAKNAALPNVTGERGMLAGNALMFSWRFLLMAVGAALGGAAAAKFGYQTAFIINAVSFLISAYSVWIIPERDMRAHDDTTTSAGGDDGISVPALSGQGQERTHVWTDIIEGWKYIAQHRLVGALVGLNILWALGGGASYLVYERLGGVVFAEREGYEPDAGVALLYAAVGAGLFIGLIGARRVGASIEMRGITLGYIGWMVIAHGILFALAGVMPTLWLAALMFAFSRIVIGLEFAVQETLLMRLLPDRLRGRVFTTDRAAEIFVMSLATIAAGWSLNFMSPRVLAIVSGALAGLPVALWLALLLAGKLHLPRDENDAAEHSHEIKEAEGGLAQTV